MAGRHDARAGAADAPDWNATRLDLLAMQSVASATPAAEIDGFLKSIAPAV